MNGSEPWKLAATAVALVLVTSAVIAVIAWTTSDVEFRVEAPRVEAEPAKSSVRMAVVAPQASAMSVPPPYAIAACNGQAGRVLAGDGQVELLKAGVLGSGTLYGLDQAQKNDARYREAYARCMRSRGYSR